MLFLFLIYDMWSLDIHTGPSKIYCLNQKEEFISA